MKPHRIRPGAAFLSRIPVTTAMALVLVGSLATPSVSNELDAPSGSATVDQTYVSAESRALAEAAESGEPVEVLSLRTEASQVFANPSGTFT